VPGGGPPGVSAETWGMVDQTTRAV
jgi:hypothetical protein